MTQTKNRVLLFIALPCFFVFGLVNYVTKICYGDESGNAFKKELSHLTENGGYALYRNNIKIAAENENSPFIPASILKIATSLAALKILGPEYRFQTLFYLSKQNDLYIKGFGDPYLTSEEIILIMENLKESGVRRINNIFLDESAFNLAETNDVIKDSLNPYDARNHALATNFNTVHFRKKNDGSVVSAEMQTPTLPIMERLAQNLPPGKHRINISLDENNILFHSGQLFRALQERHGIGGEGIISRKNVPKDLDPIYIHLSSKSLEQIVSGLLLYSNNFIANQVYLACGAKKMGYPATWQKSRQVFEDFFASLDLSKEDIFVVEGSGLSRKNRITPSALIKILLSFQQFSHLLPSDHGRLIKSGTLQGVYSYAGYFRKNDQLDPFVLILNQQKNLRDQCLNLLEKIHEAP